MKIPRNDPCPCGSGKKYKRCCISKTENQQAEIFDSIEQAVAINPNLTIDELNVIAQAKASERNNRPLDDFCGLAPAQMANWLYAPIQALENIKICSPTDLSNSPVISYLQLILETIIAEGGSLKATAKGNLPVRLVQEANKLLPNFAASNDDQHISISEFVGSNEDKFNALHYTRIVAEVADIIYIDKGRFFIQKAVFDHYQKNGITILFKPMLEAAIKNYNWGYLDGWPDDIDLRTFWLFMLWRLQFHGSFTQLVGDVSIAFPELLAQIPENELQSREKLLSTLIEVRFVTRFLGYWGFVSVTPKRYQDGKPIPFEISLEPLLKQCFKFSV